MELLSRFSEPSLNSKDPEYIATHFFKKKKENLHKHKHLHKHRVEEDDREQTLYLRH